MSSDLTPLARWLKGHRHTQMWLAEQLGVERQAVNKWVNRRGNPSIENAYKIIALSGGELRMPDLVPPPEGVSRSQLIPRRVKQTAESSAAG